MIITLSEERNEKLLCEWSGEISDKHAQDFCDVCNQVFRDHFDLEYMHRKYDVNCYGRSFIIVVYKDGKPAGTMGVWRNDFDERPAFQLVDFATVESARKGGYDLEMLFAIFNEVNNKCPGGLIYAFPHKMSYPVYSAAGFACQTLHKRIFHGANQDFLNSMPFIDDTYVEQYLTKKKRIGLVNIKGKCYLVALYKAKRIIPAAQFLGEVNSSCSSAFKRVSRVRLLVYRSTKPGILRNRGLTHAVTYDPASVKQVMGRIPPYFMEDSCTLDFNGLNPGWHG